MSTQTSGTAARKPKRDLLTFDRHDRWGLAALLGLASLGAVATTVVTPLVGWLQGGDLRVPFSSDIAVPVLDGMGLQHGPGDYDLIIPDPTATQRILDLIPGLGWLALIVAGCWILLRVMGDIGRGDPFAPDNVRRLRVLAVLVAIGWPVLAGLRFIASFVITTGLGLGNIGLAFTVPFVPLVVGVVVALLAEAFKAGSRLRDDVDGLV